MSAHRSAWVAFALALLFLIPLVPTAGPGAQDVAADEPLAAGEGRYVRIHVSDAEASALGPGVEIIESYGSFVLARARDDVVTRLTASGIDVQAEEPFALRINGYEFDTRADVRVPAPLAADPVRTDFGYYIVQFIGPVKADWRSQLESAGADVLAYVPNDAYLLRASPNDLAAIRSLRAVQWIGDYHPAYKISQDLAAATGPVEVFIVVHDGQRANAVVASLNKMGLGVVERFTSEVGIEAWHTYEDYGLVVARIDPSFIVPIARLPQVQFLQPKYEMQTFHQSAQFVLQTNATVNGSGVRRIFDMGIRGQNQVVAVADTGLDFDHSQFRHSQSQVTLGDIYNVTDQNRRKVVRYLPMSGFVGVNPFTGGDPEAIKDSPGATFCFGGATGHGTATASSAAGDDTTISPGSLNDGMAPLAKLVTLDIGSIDATGCDTLAYIPDDYGDMYGAAYATVGGGARIFSNSWGGSANSYTLEAANVDRFIWNNPDAFILFANGNSPPNALVGSPATAKNVLAVSGSASWNNREAMGAASRGPTTDGRRKPDLSTFFSTASPDLAALSDGTLTSFNNFETGFGGTSYATPLAAGMAALLRQYYRAGWYPTGNPTGGVALTPSAALMKATMTASSAPMTAASACPASDNRYPNIAQGWGRLWLDEALYFPGDTRKLWVADHPTGIRTGETLEYRLRVASPAGKLRVMLAWSDFPGLPSGGTTPALVNNLDLEVIDQSGAVFRGNVQGSCGSGQTLTGGTFDILNNLEGVSRISPPTGELRIRVIATNVPMGPQRFAVAVVSDLDRNYGVVTIDKTIYSEADNILIEVRDGDASGTLTALLTSGTEPGGESVSLVSVGSATFRGFIATNYGQPGPDGRLQVSHGDTITVTYNDPSPPHASTATARAEIDPPAISDVRATSITNAAATIQWTTDKASDSTVYFGTTPALGSTATDFTAATLHGVTLTGLTTETVYYYDVASTRAGHTVRDSNGGLHYRFKTTEKAEILLVVGEGSFPAERVDFYRNALAAASWSWNEWEVAGNGDPSLATLQTYKAVLWNSGLEQYPPITDTQVNLLTNYVNGGGRLLVSGHDIAWASCDGASAYSSPTRCNFVRSIMKGDYVADPTTFSQEQGVAADPISGAYTGGVSYVPHRDGGAADEVNTLNAGGTASTVWRTNSGGSPPWDGLRWVSAGDNGTAGPSCVWCGAPSRVVSLFFEFTGINYVAGQPISPQRTDILNKTIVWLLGRNPPVVRVTTPNGGETISTNALAVTWTRSQPLGSQEIWYSKDAGASWDLVKTVAGTNTTDTIDISNIANWPNGDRYLIRVVAVDAGTPPLKAQDASNAVFTVRRAGGDVDGPIVRPGSLRVSPNPVKEAATVRINATIDDALRGGSTINAAEYFVQPTTPNAGQYGSGTALNAVDGTLDEVVEDVTLAFTAPWALGSTVTIWVHGRDAATPTNNWGGFGGGNSTGGSIMIVVIPASSGPPPNPPTAVQAALVAPTFADVRITWTIPGGPVIDHFEIYFSTSYSSSKTSYALLPGANNLPPSTTSFDHVGAGVGDSSTYFYYVRSVNAGGGANSAEQVAKYFRQLTTGGWHLLSIPVTPADPSLLTALQTMSWRTARTYAASDAADPWDAWSVVSNSGDFRTVSAGTALWVDLVAPDDLVVAGQVPASTTITLVPNAWNFVGYASFLPANAQTSLAGRGVTVLEGYAAAPQYYLQRLPIASTTLAAGNGYWVYATTGGAWTVMN